MSHCDHVTDSENGMLRWLIKKQWDKEEHRLGKSVDYLRHALNVSRAIFAL